MKKSFTEPFIKSNSEAYLLVEVEDGVFVQFVYKDELETQFANVLKTDIYSREDLTLVLAKLLYENGLVMKSFREIAAETSAVFSFVDDTPGSQKEEICFHVLADRTDRPIPTNLGDPVFVNIRELVENFRESPSYMPAVVRYGIAQIIHERRLG